MRTRAASYPCLRHSAERCLCGNRLRLVWARARATILLQLSNCADELGLSNARPRAAVAPHKACYRGRAGRARSRAVTRNVSSRGVPAARRGRPEPQSVPRLRQRRSTRAIVSCCCRTHGALGPSARKQRKPLLAQDFFGRSCSQAKRTDPVLGRYCEFRAASAITLPHAL